MKRTLLIALIAVLTAGCDRQTELLTNTEEYFAAHGIVQGQPNELRIGGTLFRFPAGVGLNPETAQSEIRWFDGSPETIRTLSSKQCLEQEKCEIVVTPIVKGHADKVTFYLEPERDYAPNPSPFGGGVRVTISKHGFYKWDGINANPDELLKRIEGRKIVDHPELGLRKYVAPGSAGSTYYESLKADMKSESGHGQFFECQSASSGLCFRSYWNEKGNYQVEVDVGKPFFLDHWQEIYPAVVRFVDSVAVK